MLLKKTSKGKRRKQSKNHPWRSDMMSQRSELSEYYGYKYEAKQKDAPFKAKTKKAVKFHDGEEIPEVD